LYTSWVIGCARFFFFNKDVNKVALLSGTTYITIVSNNDKGVSMGTAKYFYITGNGFIKVNDNNNRFCIFFSEESVKGLIEDGFTQMNNN